MACGESIFLKCVASKAEVIEGAVFRFFLPLGVKGNGVILIGLGLYLL